MKQVRQLGFLVIALMATSCSGAKERAADVKSAGKPSVAAATTKATPANRLCSLFTAAEIEDLLGVRVGEGHSAGPMRSACQWDGNNAGDEAVNARGAQT
jgi:hypothetical protein